MFYQDNFNKIYTLNMSEVCEETVFNIFYKNCADIIYICDNNNTLSGIISCGDFVKNFEDKSSWINYNFKKIINFSDSDLNYKNAENLLKKYSYISRVPLVDSNGKLLGEFLRNKNNLIQINEKEKNLIKKYLKITHLEVIYLKNDNITYSDFKKMSLDNHKKLISNSIIRHILLKVFFKPNNLLYIIDLLDSAVCFFKLNEICSYLIKNNVECYFFERANTIENGNYSDKAKSRMKKSIMLDNLVNNIDKYEYIFKDLFEDLYSKDYINSLYKIPPVIKKGDLYVHLDYQSQYVNVINGKRITIDQPEEYIRTIYMYGRCGIFGYLTEDKYTLPSLLQKKINENSSQLQRVVNCGLWGAQRSKVLNNLEMEYKNFKQGDCFIFKSYFFKEEIDYFLKIGIKYYDLNYIIYENKDSRNSFFDFPGHMTHKGYSVEADYIYSIIKDGYINENTFTVRKEPLFDEIESEFDAENSDNIKDSELINGINEYTEEIRTNYPIDYKNSIIGSIVMNCNPFTLGHQYLIECASKEVDYLFIFILQEDKSEFKFKDRIELVKQGTKHLKNVFIIGSKEYIISTYTFPEYFNKNQLSDAIIDSSTDLTLFSKYIAPKLNISIRFFGTEPLDNITRQYNQNMKKILPEYGIKFKEIPRKTNEENIISASIVRKLLNDKNYEELKEYVPYTTYDFLMNNIN